MVAISPVAPSPVAPSPVSGPTTTSLAVANTAPDARDDAITIHEDQLYSGSVFAAHGFGADTDPEGGALRVVAVEDHATYVGLGLNLIAGRVRVMADGRFWFDARGHFDYLRAGESVTVSFDYTIADPQGLQDTATVTMTVTGRDDPPVLREDTIYSHETATTSGNVFADNGFGADVDPDGDTLRVTKFLGSVANAGDLVDLPGGGKVRLMENGQFWFVADGDFDDLRAGEFRDTAFTYRATDGTYTKVSTVTVRVEGFNTPPVAPDFEFAADEDKTISQHVLGRYPNTVYDAEGDPVVIFSVNGLTANVGKSIDLAGGGRLRLEKDGHFWFNPDGDFDDLDPGETRVVTATYAVSDGDRSSAQGELTFTVRGTTSDPVAEETIPVPREDAFVFSLSGDMSGNLFEDNGFGEDYDLDGDPLSVFFFQPQYDDGDILGDTPSTFNLVDGGQVRIGADGDIVFFAEGRHGTLTAGQHFDMAYNLRYVTEFGTDATSFVDVSVDIIA